MHTYKRNVLYPKNTVLKALIQHSLCFQAAFVNRNLITSRSEVITPAAINVCTIKIIGKSIYLPTPKRVTF
jgi:hypothetical protein